MHQIPREKLKKWTWYVGRGRNGNVGLWNGEEFLVITATSWPGVKREPYYTAERGCFQPFRAIDEGEMLEPLVEDGIPTRHAHSLVFAQECEQEQLDTLQALQGMEFLVAGRSALALQAVPPALPAVLSLIVPASTYAVAARCLGIVAKQEKATADSACFRRHSSRVRLSRLDDDLFRRLAAQASPVTVSRCVLPALTPANLLGMYCGLPHTLDAEERADGLLLDVVDSLSTADHDAALNALREAGAPDAAATLDDCLERARRRRWSWSEFIELRKAERERLRRPQQLREQPASPDRS